MRQLETLGGERHVLFAGGLHGENDNQGGGGGVTAINEKDTAVTKQHRKHGDQGL
jgi:hypothetical protein